MDFGDNDSDYDDANMPEYVRPSYKKVKRLFTRRPVSSSEEDVFADNCSCC